MGLVHSVVQVILSETSITLTNTTVWPCSTTLASEINNQMAINVPPGVPTYGLLDVELESFKMSMSLPVCDGNGCTEKEIGYFTTPVTHLKLGNNNAAWDVGATLASADVVLQDFIIPLFMEQKTLNLKLSADDVSLGLKVAHALKIPMKRLKLEKSLSCKMLAIGGAKTIPEKFCAGGKDQSQGYSISCTPAASGSAAGSSVVV